MARIPEGAELIENPVSKAPGFKIGNVIVMAGVPAIMETMLIAVTPRLKTGPKLLSASISAPTPRKGRLPLGSLVCQRGFPDVAMGSYPFFENGRSGTNLVLRSTEEGRLRLAKADLIARLGPKLTVSGNDLRAKHVAVKLVDGKKGSNPTPRNKPANPARRAGRWRGFNRRFRALSNA